MSRPRFWGVRTDGQEPALGGEQKSMRPEDIRREMRSARNALSPEAVEELSRRIAEKLEELPEYRQAGIVMIYRAVQGEVRLDLLRGKKFIYPLCTGPGEMCALLPLGEEAWRKGAFGIPEPIRELSVEIAPEKIDLVLCPCTAFDTGCRRLGMGGGYYDRFLPRCTKAKFIAVAYEFQRVAALEARSWDIPMDAVVTEERVYRRKEI